MKKRGRTKIKLKLRKKGMEDKGNELHWMKGFPSPREPFSLPAACVIFISWAPKVTRRKKKIKGENRELYFLFSFQSVSWYKQM